MSQSNSLTPWGYSLVTTSWQHDFCLASVPNSCCFLVVFPDASLFRVGWAAKLEKTMREKLWGLFCELGKNGLAKKKPHRKEVLNCFPKLGINMMSTPTCHRWHLSEKWSMSTWKAMEIQETNNNNNNNNTTNTNTNTSTSSSSSKESQRVAYLYLYLKLFCFDLYFNIFQLSTTVSSLKKKQNSKQFTWDSCHGGWWCWKINQ